MLNCFKMSIALTLFFVTSICHAIQVNVQTVSDDVYAVGFTVNGVQYGAAGTSYQKDNLPSGASYQFGIRVGGLVLGAEDITCVTVNGLQSTVVLITDSIARLSYDIYNKKCYMELS